jgi:hydrogenase expression/formation protein HypD
VKFIDEYRDAAGAQGYARAIRALATRPWTIMEVCGGQTHAIVRFGIDELLPPALTLVHGPGCPVCVTPVDLIDRAIAIASRPEVVFCSYGDMLRVPGSDGDLLGAKAEGAELRVVYSPMDAVDLALARPERQVVFFAVGFETTAPATALAAVRARRLGLENFSLLAAHVLVPPAMELVLASPERRIDAFLAAGHVSAIIGCEPYEAIRSRFRVPIVVTGFEPLDILQGIAMCVRQLEEGRAEVENQYARAVRPRGNPLAQALLREVFEVVPRRWRGVGLVAQSGLGLSAAYRSFDALARFGGGGAGADDPPSECISGLVLQGIRKPPECPAFGTRCTPERPLGATMVSTEGACAAYHRYRRRADGGAER